MVTGADGDAATGRNVTENAHERVNPFYVHSQFFAVIVWRRVSLSLILDYSFQPLDEQRQPTRWDRDASR
jgi:hypothetical protein